MPMPHALASWPARRWAFAGLVAAAYLLVVALSTALIDNPVFGRAIPPTWWAWPALVVAAVLTGLLAATYLRRPGQAGTAVEDHELGSRRGVLGAALTWFAVGCPVCNKVALLVLGYAGALTWFQPLQPILYAAAVTALVWALRVRLRGELACPVDPRPARELTG